MFSAPSETIISWGSNNPASDITVAVSLYNYSEYIVECLSSIALQDELNIDIIVVDDSSVDNSLQVANRWMSVNAGRFNRGSLIAHDYNFGLACARNTAFARAESKYIFVIDADNAIFPSAIRKLRRGLLDGAAASYSQLQLFGTESSVGIADMWDIKFLARGPYIDAMALIAKEAWETVGGYTHIDGGWEDYDFWCKFAGGGLYANYIPEILCRYRIHEKSMLRVETKTRYQEIYNKLSFRHPWVKLDSLLLK